MFFESRVSPGAAAFFYGQTGKRTAGQPLVTYIFGMSADVFSPN